MLAMTYRVALVTEASHGATLEIQEADGGSAPVAHVATWPEAGARSPSFLADAAFE